ncbi:hypothetical protein ABMA27_009480 [Loxostege sticticalis]|uniref:Uncharacterized protein n=1 Tax=Loxostege sticticalis TaxID=481309 RepID=A0ABR3H825_LOXSC
MDTPDEVPKYPPPPPPKRLDRPKITLQIPGATSPVTPRGPLSATPMGTPYWGSSRYRGRPPTTPGSHISDPHGNPYFNPFVHMYHNKASEFMFKQFEGFKDFTMNTAKSGLSAGEKSAFWFVNKLKILSKRWFTHLFLTLCLVLYSIMGAAMFYALEVSLIQGDLRKMILVCYAAHTIEEEEWVYLFSDDMHQQTISGPKWGIFTCPYITLPYHCFGTIVG